MVTIGLLIGTTVASVIGLQDYLGYVAIHQASHREFATSTPDYFAGFLVMTIPITLALLIGSLGNVSKAGVLVYGLSLLIQLPVLAATGSRFAIVAMFAGFISLAIGLWSGARSGITMPKVDRRALALALVVIVLGGIVGGHTILNRIVGPAAKAQNNSIMFRWWTWKGSERTALANPVFGTGPGTFPYAYQKYAYCSEFYTGCPRCVLPGNHRHRLSRRHCACNRPAMDLFVRHALDIEMVDRAADRKRGRDAGPSWP